MPEDLCIRAIWRGSDPQMRHAIETIGSMLEMQFGPDQTTEEIWINVLRSFATAMDIDLIAFRLTPLEFAAASALRPEQSDSPPHLPYTPTGPARAPEADVTLLAG